MSVYQVKIYAYTDDTDNRRAQIHASISEALRAIGVNATEIVLDEE